MPNVLFVDFGVITGGETEAEKVRVDLLENQAMDFRNGFVRLCYTDFVSRRLNVFTVNLGTH